MPKHQEEILDRTEEKTEITEPKMYDVLLINDDFTPMDFVVAILQRIFNKTYAEAIRLMLTVHNEGEGVAGTYAFAVAETKAAQVIATAEANQHPLRCEVREKS